MSTVMQWVESNQFVLSLGLHDGWTTVIYPWDDSPACTATNNAVTVEDATFYQVQDYKTFSLTSNNYICLNCISSGGNKVNCVACSAGLAVCPPPLLHAHWQVSLPSGASGNSEN